MAQGLEKTYILYKTKDSTQSNQQVAVVFHDAVSDSQRVKEIAAAHHQEIARYETPIAVREIPGLLKPVKCAGPNHEPAHDLIRILVAR